MNEFNNKYGLTEQENKEVTQKAREHGLKVDAGLAAGGAAMYGAGKILPHYALKKAPASAKIVAKLAAREAYPTKGATLEEVMKRERRLRSLRMKAIKTQAKIRPIASIGSALKSAGKVSLAGAATTGLLHGVSAYLDKDKQGINDDKTIQGDRKGWMLGAGAGLIGLGTLGSLRLGNKALKGVTGGGSPTMAIKKAIDHEKRSEAVRKGYTDSKGTFKSMKDYNDWVKWKKENPMPKLVTDEADSFAKGMSNLGNAKTVDEYLKGREQALKSGKEVLDNSDMDKNALRQISMYEGLKGAGGMAIGGEALRMAGKDDYSKEAKKKAEEKEQAKQLKKQSSLILGSGLGHLAQNGLYEAATKTKAGSKKTSDFLTNRMMEGYTGKAAKDSLADGLARFNATFDPLRFGKSKMQHYRDSIKAGRKISGRLKGSAYNLMPEAENAAKEAREFGHKIRQEKIDLHNLGEEDKTSLKHLANGDIHLASEHIAKAPVTSKIVESLFPRLKDNQRAALLGEISLMGKDDKGLQALSKEFKKTNGRRILKGISDKIERDGGLPTMGKESLRSREANEKIGYNAGHATLAALEPGAAVLNGIKRVMGAGKQEIKDSDSKLARGAKKVSNAANMVANAAFVTVPTAIAKAKGAAGIAYKNDKVQKAKRLLFSPAIEDIKEDAQRNYKGGMDVLKSLHENKQLAKHMPEQIEKIKKIESGAGGKLDKVTKRYGGGLKGIVRGVKDAKAAAGKALGDKDIVNAGKGAVKVLSEDQDKVREGKEMIENAKNNVLLKNEKKTDRAIEKNTEKSLKKAQDAEDYANDLEMKYRKWVLPGTAIGTGAIAAPSLVDIHKRNKEAANNEDSKKNKKVA